MSTRPAAPARPPQRGAAPCPARDGEAGQHRAGFDLDRPWCLDEQVSVRPEPFGALMYHFGTRRLSFLKTPTMLAVVRSLGEHPDARAACAAAGVNPGELPAYQRALAALAESQTIRERPS